MPASKDSSANKHGLVRLNVGGTWYTTTASTMNAFPDSIFPRMMSKRPSQDSDKSGSLPREIAEDDKGYYFIDRDGELFRHVLNFMRSSQLRLPSGFTEHAQLRSEAKFYGIKALVESLGRFPEDASYNGGVEPSSSSASQANNQGRNHTIIEVIETSHPEKIGVCSSRLVLTEDLRNAMPFAEVLNNMPKHYQEEYRGHFGRFWVRTNVTRLDWAERLRSAGWQFLGTTSVCRRLPDVTGQGTDLCHIIEKWSLGH